MKTLREHLLVILLFLVLVFLFTLPFSIHIGDHVLAIPVDNLLNAYIMAWDAHALVTNPAALFQANFNYPSRDALAFSEHLFTLGLLSLPIRLVSRNPILAHNLLLLICFALCGYTMYLLAKYLTRNRLAALAAGFFFAFVPYHFSTIVHVHVTLYFLQPLVLLFLIRYFEEGGKRFLFGFGLAFLSQALLSWYQLAFSTIPVAFYLVWRLFLIRRRQHLAALVKVVLTLILCLLLVIPFALPYLRLRKNVPESESSPAENPILEAKPADYLRVIDENLLYANLGILKKGHIGEGNALFPGFAVIPLVLLALISISRRRRGCNILLPERDLTPAARDIPSPRKPSGVDVSFPGSAFLGDESFLPRGGGFPDSLKPSEIPGPSSARCVSPLAEDGEANPAGHTPSALAEGTESTEGNHRPGCRSNYGGAAKKYPGGGAGNPGWMMKPRSYIVFFLLLAAFCFVLSAGRKFMGFENFLFRALHRLPIYSLVRFPIRYHIVVVLSLAVLSAYGIAYLHRLLESRGRRLAAFAAVSTVMALMLVEFSVLFMPFEPVPMGPAVPEVYRDLAGMERGVVLEAPTPTLVNFSDYEDPLVISYGSFDNMLVAASREQAATYYSTYHWQKIVNGMSGYYPLFYRRVLAEMLSFPSSRSLSFMRALGVRYLIVHWDYFPGKSGETVRAHLETIPGLVILRDYPPDITLCALEGTETLLASGLERRVFLPLEVNPGESFNASLGIFNPSERPFLNTDEYRMHLNLSWKDASGQEVLSEEVYYYFPFYIHPWEEKVTGFQGRAPTQEGRYELTVTALDGPLQGEVWRAPVTVTPVPPGGDGEGLAGILTLDLATLGKKDIASRDTDGTGSEVIRLRLEPGELFSLPVQAANLGTSGWVRYLPGETGRVEVTAFWNPEEAPELRAVQHGLLPCDMSPGQQAAFSVALQAPLSPGDYNLTLALNCLYVAQISKPVTVRVEVR
ncbi:hypothetical protein [Candidatus Solincola sp.]|nr:hypothetical protein [Actinomycetota bacterium]